MKGLLAFVVCLLTAIYSPVKATPVVAYEAKPQFAEVEVEVINAYALLEDISTVVAAAALSRCAVPLALKLPQTSYAAITARYQTMRKLIYACAPRSEAEHRRCLT